MAVLGRRSEGWLKGQPSSRADEVGEAQRRTRPAGKLLLGPPRLPEALKGRAGEHRQCLPWQPAALQVCLGWRSTRQGLLGRPAGATRARTSSRLYLAHELPADAHPALLPTSRPRPSPPTAPRSRDAERPQEMPGNASSQLSQAGRAADIPAGLTLLVLCVRHRPRATSPPSLHRLEASKHSADTMDVPPAASASAWLGLERCASRLAGLVGARAGATT